LILADGAFMIPVADAEDALRAHPHITDVAVVGWRDNLEGCAVLVSTVPVTLDDVRSYLSGLGMTEWCWPIRGERVEALPRNHMGKVERARPASTRAPTLARAAASSGSAGSASNGTPAAGQQASLPHA
jgi:non-ribosomal peptide synthetase component E (peptide arylation enzyme)